MRAALLLLLVTTIGCGEASPPDVGAIKQYMSPEQLALGDPIVNQVGLVLVPIPAGQFQMGAAANDRPARAKYESALREPKVQAMLKSGQITKADLLKHFKQESQDRAGGKPDASPESPQHLVKITQPYYLSVFEVTQEQYEQVMGTSPWQGKPLAKEQVGYAASYVTWEDAVEFCRKLTSQENQQYRLPTEAEWEHACRAGTVTTWCFGDDPQQLGEYAWYDGNAYHDDQQYAHCVGQKLPNGWGLYDMHGNVWEWCHDWYARYDGRQKGLVDPRGPKKGRHRVWRGGSFADATNNTHSATRLSHGREGYHPEYLAGFRVVREFKSGE